MRPLEVQSTTAFQVKLYTLGRGFRCGNLGKLSRSPVMGSQRERRQAEGSCCRELTWEMRTRP
jgi:hypothetical protein